MRAHLLTLPDDAMAPHKSALYIVDSRAHKSMAGAGGRGVLGGPSLTHRRCAEQRLKRFVFGISVREIVEPKREERFTLIPLVNASKESARKHEVSERIILVVPIDFEGVPRALVDPILDLIRCRFHFDQPSWMIASDDKIRSVLLALPPVRDPQFVDRVLRPQLIIAVPEVVQETKGKERLY